MKNVELNWIVRKQSGLRTVSKYFRFFLFLSIFLRNLKIWTIFLVGRLPGYLVFLALPQVICIHNHLPKLLALRRVSSCTNFEQTNDQKRRNFWAHDWNDFCSFSLGYKIKISSIRPVQCLLRGLLLGILLAGNKICINTNLNHTSID